MRVIGEDPRCGAPTTTVPQIDRRDPAPSIFEIPSGYGVVYPEDGQQ